MTMMLLAAGLGLLLTLLFGVMAIVQFKRGGHGLGWLWLALTIVALVPLVWIMTMPVETHTQSITIDMPATGQR